MTDAIYAGRMAQLAVQTGGEINDLTLESYWESLQHFDDDVFVAATKLLSETHSRFPTLCDIRRQCLGIIHDRKRRLRNQEILATPRISAESKPVKLESNDFLKRNFKRCPNLFEGIELVADQDNEGPGAQ